MGIRSFYIRHTATPDRQKATLGPSAHTATGTLWITKMYIGVNIDLAICFVARRDIASASRAVMADA